MTPRVTKARFHPAPSASNDRGLVGWIDFVLDDSIGIDGVELRRARDGVVILVYPRRRDREGREHYIVRPLDERTRAAIEAQVITLLGMREAS